MIFPIFICTFALQNKSAEMEKKTILITEDNESNYTYLWLLLRSQYNILRANNGAEAVEITSKENIDLILMDIKMPVMTGIEALIEIRKTKPNLPIVMQSSYAFDQDVQEAMSCGATDYLTKPIMRDQLANMLTKLGI